MSKLPPQKRSATLLQEYIEASLSLSDAEKEILIVEKRVKDVPLPPKVDITYYHDAGTSLYSEHNVLKQLFSRVSDLKMKKEELIDKIRKHVAGDGELSSVTSGQKGQEQTALVAPKISLSSFTEAIDAVTAELSDIIRDESTSDATGLKLFVHDRLGHSEPPLHFSSWEQRFAQRAAQARDKVGKAKQGLVDVVNAVSITFKAHNLVQSEAMWTRFVSLIDETLVGVLVESLYKALDAYCRQFEGRNVRELFSVNLKLTQTCACVMVPTAADLKARYTPLIRQSLLGVCPDNAVAHVISQPSSKTKDGDISPKKRCAEDPSIATLFVRLEETFNRNVCDELQAAADAVQKMWGRFWSPTMAVADGPTLLRAITTIQSEFDVNQTIHGGAVLLNLFPLQDAVISMIHTQIENAKDNEIKSLVDVWTKASQQQTVKIVSELNGATNTFATKAETRPLTAIAEPSPPMPATGLTPKSKTLDKTFNPLATALRVVESSKKRTVDYVSITAKAPPISKPQEAFDQQPTPQPTTPRHRPTDANPRTGHTPPPPLPPTTSSSTTSKLPPPPPPAVPRTTTTTTTTGTTLEKAAERSLPTALSNRAHKAKPYTTMTVEEVVDDLPTPTRASKNSPDLFTETAANDNNATTGCVGTTTKAESKSVPSANVPGSPTTPRNVADSAAEFRRRVEAATSATAAAAQRREELSRQTTPRTGARLAALQRTATSSPPTAQLQTSSSASVPPPAVFPTNTNTGDARPPVMSAWETPTKAELPSNGSLITPANSLSGGTQLPLKPIIKNKTSPHLGDYQPPASAPLSTTTGNSGRRPSRVEFDPATTTGGNGPTPAFKKASTPSPDDDDTILRKLMQKEKESMERIRAMKEREEQRRKEIAAAHRKTVAEESTPSLGGHQPESGATGTSASVPASIISNTPAITSPKSTAKTEASHPIALPPISHSGAADSPRPQRGITATNSGSHLGLLIEARREELALNAEKPLGTRNAEQPSSLTPTPVSSVGMHRSGLLGDVASLRSAADPLRSDGMRPATTSAQTGSRPDSALRRKLALPPVQTQQGSSTSPLRPSPPASEGVSTLRKPQTAPASSPNNGGTPRGLAAKSPLLSPSTTSLLDLYKSYCTQYAIKPNSGLLKMLPKVPGENIAKINLDLNYIGVKGFQPLLQVLKVNRGLTLLNLKDNNLENNEVRALVAVLSTESGDTLQHLDLSNNPISLAGGTAVMDLISKQKSLRTVVVSGTLIQPKIVEKIAEMLQK